MTTEDEGRDEAVDPDDADTEIEAMASISKVLKSLGEDERRRVLDWAARKYGTPGSAPMAQSLALVRTDEAAAEQGPTYEHFAELYNQVRPTTDVERALTASYWVQTIEGKKPFTSMEVNTRLKEISTGLAHMADAMGALQTRRPALVIQLRKSGRTRQARKTYLVTPEGIAAVRNAIASGAFRRDGGTES